MSPNLRPLRLALAGAFALSGAALAQSTALPAIPSFDLERLQLNPAMQSSLVLAGGQQLSEGAWRVSTAAHYENGAALWGSTDVAHRASAQFALA